MSISSAMNTAKLGLLAQARAIQVAANNVSNANTPGYTRQRPIFEPVVPSRLASGFALGGGTFVNIKKHLAFQMILDDPETPVRHPIGPKEEDAPTP